MQIPQHVHTLIVGSGAAGLSTAVQLSRAGVDDLLIVTEGLQMGTSINTGSDKQTYYKLSMCDRDADSPREMADTYFAGGSMHGDLALVEASVSARAFLNLVEIGVPFPHDPFGQFIGYKTDHDPRRRATSIGPYTSREMCRRLIAEVERRGIPLLEKHVVSDLITVPTAEGPRAAGAVVVNRDGEVSSILANNVVFAVGGPGGLYASSVYPAVHTGAIGVAMRAGARCQNLPESQYGLASTRFRWNVSGTYMQVLPRFISTDTDGNGVPCEFMREYFESVGAMNSRIFLKGYQWPFDSRKVIGGSSLVDILVYIETVLKGRRVFLDYRSNTEGLTFEGLDEEAHTYLEKSGACFGTPIERLEKMNPRAIELYADHGIDIRSEPLEVAVCAQHNNGGLAGDLWWESVNIAHLFPVGEVNGSHGVYRPGGSALNSGQVGAARAAQAIANRYAEGDLPQAEAREQAEVLAAATTAWLSVAATAPTDWRTERQELQERMSRYGAHIRQLEGLDGAIDAAWGQVERLDREGCRPTGGNGIAEALATRQLCYAHAVYLESVRAALQSGIGSRGSAITLDATANRVHAKLDAMWSIVPEDERFRDQVLETRPREGGASSAWVPVRPLPESDTWFETAWARYNSGEIYRTALNEKES